MTTLLDLSDPAPEPGPADWNDEGVVYLPGFLDPEHVARYLEEWAVENGYHGLTPAHPLPEGGGGHWDTGGPGDPTRLMVLDAERPGGWPNACPYMSAPAMRALACDRQLAAELAKLTGEDMGLHLNLTGWVSTRRNWHQDGYLNPGYVGDYYAAVWMALGDVHPDSGVFEFVPGSHRWHRLTNEKVRASGIVDMNDPAWPAHTEAVLTELVDKEIAERQASTVRYVPERGDVLIWHPRLYHRGTAPTVPGAYRPALIAHYSGVRHRPDMPTPVRHGADGGWYFPIVDDLPVAEGIG